MDYSYMELAISLAKQGEGRVNPNPLVGAVIVKNNRIIGQGYHKQYGGLHAEREAFQNLTENCQGAEMYVTLEPCCHHGKQPPCTDAIIQHGIKTVYIGSADPNPLVSGKGTQILREHGIQVVEQVMKAECDAINPVFFHYIRNKLPYVALKYAMTLDGKTATHTGLSKWITNETARQHVHKLRNYYTGIMVGIGTVIKDDPMLNCRIDQGRNPIRIICDSQLRIPLDSQIVKTASTIPTIIATRNDANPQKAIQLREKQISILPLPAHNGHIDLTKLMQELGKREMDGILLEGGGTLSEAMLQAGHIQQLYAYIAPKIFGGSGTYSPVGGLGVSSPNEAWQFQLNDITTLGEDILLTYIR